RTLQLRPERMAAQLEPSLLATDLADYLVKKGMPFRQAHGVVGQVVALAEEMGMALTAVPLPQLQSISDYFDEKVTAVFQIKSALENRFATGGTASQALQAQLKQAQSTANHQSETGSPSTS
ncbi:MAG: argininosuccinate lyase, partial [Anaerolineae bacterium]